MMTKRFPRPLVIRPAKTDCKTVDQSSLGLQPTAMHRAATRRLAPPQTGFPGSSDRFHGAVAVLDRCVDAGRQIRILLSNGGLKAAATVLDLSVILVTSKGTRKGGDRVPWGRGALVITILAGLGNPISAQDTGGVFQKYEARARKAVDRGYEYLLSVEQPDGSFPESHGRSTGISSLVGMSYLAMGHLPGQGRYGDAINRRIDYALAKTSADGLIDCGDHGNGPMYAHNISTLFLSEVSGMVDQERQNRIDTALSKAIQVILRAQAVPKSVEHQGGWRYQPNSNDSDLSCSGWALMALRSARLNGAPVPPQAIKDAVDYTLRRFDRKVGHFGYMDQAQHKDSLTGAGLMCLELCGRHATRENLLAGDWILQNHESLPRAEFEFYGNYYNAQGMFQLGGKYWQTYAEWMYPHYLEEQNEDGSWLGERFGRVYGTSMMILAFTVPARQLPIYQRDERVDGGP